MSIEKNEQFYCVECGWLGEMGEDYDHCYECGSTEIGLRDIQSEELVLNPISIVNPIVNTKNSIVNTTKDSVENLPLHNMIDISVFEKTFDKLNDELSDVCNRMMEQETTMKGLITAIDQQNATIQHQTDALWLLIDLLKPKEKIDPSVIDIPFFEKIANRDPTKIERDCYLAGVSCVLSQTDIDSDEVETFLNNLGIPFVTCYGCDGISILERSVRYKNNWYGLDCCSEKIKK